MTDSDDYQKAFNEIQRFDPMVLEIVKLQSKIAQPIAFSVEKESVHRDLAVALTNVVINLSSLIDDGVNPTSILHIFTQAFANAHINAATGVELMGTPMSKRQDALINICGVIQEAVDKKSLVEDLKSIV